MIKLNILRLFTIFVILIISQSIQVLSQDESPPQLTILVYGNVYDSDGYISKNSIIDIITPHGSFQCKTDNDGVYYNSNILAYFDEKITVEVTNANKTKGGTISHIMTKQEYEDKEVNMSDIILSNFESKNSESKNSKEESTKKESEDVSSTSTENNKSESTTFATSNQTLSKEENVEVKKEYTDQITKTEDNSSSIKEGKTQTKPETNDLKRENNNLWWQVILIIIIISIMILVIAIWKKRNE